jgi:hypothetical protein
MDKEHDTQRTSVDYIKPEEMVGSISIRIGYFKPQSVVREIFTGHPSNSTTPLSIFCNDGVV